MVKRGFSLIEILVALALFGLLSALTFSSLLGLFRTNRLSNLEAEAALVAKGYLEQAVRNATYSPANGTLQLPSLNVSRGFQVSLAAGGRLPGNDVSLSSCTQNPSGWSCTVSCQKNGTSVPCPLVTVQLTLTRGGRTQVFYREWSP